MLFTKHGGKSVAANASNDTIPNPLIDYQLWKQILILILGNFIVLANLAIVVVVFTRRKIKNGGSKLCANLALCDTYVGFIIICLGSDQFAEMKFGSKHCLALLGLISWPCLMSICSIFLIAIDRYVFVVHAIYYDIWMGKTATSLAVMTTWITTLVVAFAPLFGWRKYSQHYKGCSMKSIIQVHYVIFVTVVFIWIPFVTTIVLYWRILMAVRRVSKVNAITPHDNTLTPSIRKRRRNNHKAALMVFLVVMNFLSTWVPLLTYAIVTDFARRPYSLPFSVLFLAFGNSALNPITFLVWNSECRRMIKRIILCKSSNCRRNCNTVEPVWSCREL